MTIEDAMKCELVNIICAYPHEPVQLDILYVSCFWLLDHDSFQHHHWLVQGWVLEMGMVGLEEQDMERDNDVKDLLKIHHTTP